MRSLLAEVSGKDEITDSSELDKDLGLDSLDMVDLALKIEETWGIRVPDDFGGIECLTAGDVSRYIDSLLETGG